MTYCAQDDILGKNVTNQIAVIQGSHRLRKLLRLAHCPRFFVSAQALYRMQYQNLLFGIK